MYIWTIVKVALKSLVANKLRTFLAMLGIIIGVGSVIALLSIGSGAQKQVLDQVSSMGKNSLTVRPGMRPGAGGVRAGSQQNMKIEDAEAILKELPNEVEQVSPTVNSSYQIKYFNKNTNTTVNGVSPNYFSMKNLPIDNGRAFNDGESEGMQRVAVIGGTTAIDLFGENNNPVDEEIKINGINFKVVGVMKVKGGQGFGANPDESIFVPYKIAMKQLMGVDYLRGIEIKAFDNADLTKTQEDITELLRKRHRIKEQDDNDFQIMNMAEILEQAQSFTRIFTILLGGIASISLVVGGIGIMNIMLVTVTERTREIGIRKAIGAKNKDILRQFLIESIVMTTSGGLIGLVAGVLVSYVIGKFSTFVPVVTVTSIVISMGFSMAVGVFFGYYPAMRAAKLDPIEALRYE